MLCDQFEASTLSAQRTANRYPNFGGWMHGFANRECGSDIRTHRGESCQQTARSECHFDQSRFPRLWWKGRKTWRYSPSADGEDDSKRRRTKEFTCRTGRKDELISIFNCFKMILYLFSWFNIWRKIGRARRRFQLFHLNLPFGRSIRTIPRRKCPSNWASSSITITEVFSWPFIVHSGWSTKPVSCWAIGWAFQNYVATWTAKLTITVVENHH